MNIDEFLWCEKYRPKKISECILPPNLKETFQSFVNQNNIPNLLLSGRPGIGKTTTAFAMLDELDCDYICINGSLNGDLDTLRTDITNFVSSVSFSGGRKYVVIDEADYLSSKVMAGMRGFFEEFSKNAGFIFTCNYKHRISDPLISRFSVIDFNISKTDIPKLATEFVKRVFHILEKENVEFDKKVVAEVVKKYLPDWRKILNELQRYSSNGEINSGILSISKDASIESLVDYMKAKDFSSVRKWVAQNLDDPGVVIRKFYDTASEYMTPSGIPQLVLILGEYQQKAAMVQDQEINLAAMLVEIMINAEWK